MPEEEPRVDETTRLPGLFRRRRTPNRRWLRLPMPPPLKRSPTPLWRPRRLQTSGTSAETTSPQSSRPSRSPFPQARRRASRGARDWRAGDRQLAATPRPPLQRRRQPTLLRARRQPDRAAEPAPNTERTRDGVREAAAEPADESTEQTAPAAAAVVRPTPLTATAARCLPARRPSPLPEAGARAGALVAVRRVPRAVGRRARLRRLPADAGARRPRALRAAALRLRGDRRTRPDRAGPDPDPVRVAARPRRRPRRREAACSRELRSGARCARCWAWCCGGSR